MKILITGATGKVGQHFIQRILNDEWFEEETLRALCHNRKVEVNDRLEMVKGSISDRKVVEKAMDGVTHVLHLATCKETPEDVMDVTVKGLFWLLEAARESSTFRQLSDRVVLSRNDVQYVDIAVKEPLENECKHFLDVIDRRIPPLTDGEEGMNVVKVLSAASQSAVKWENASR